MIEILKADIQKYAADAEQLAKEIAEHEEDIAVLKKQAYDRKQAASLVQVSSLKSLSLIPDEAKRAIDTFFAQEPDEGLAVSAPEANAYEFQSHGIIEMLEKLLDKFIDEKTALE